MITFAASALIVVLSSGRLGFGSAFLSAVSMMRQLLDIVNQAVQVPLCIHRRPCSQGEAVQPFVVAQVAEHGFDGRANICRSISPWRSQMSSTWVKIAEASFAQFAHELRHRRELRGAVAGNRHEQHVLAAQALDRAAGDNPAAIGEQDDLEHHSRIVGGRAGFVVDVSLSDTRQIDRCRSGSPARVRSCRVSVGSPTINNLVTRHYFSFESLS